MAVPIVMDQGAEGERQKGSLPFLFYSGVAGSPRDSTHSPSSCLVFNLCWKHTQNCVSICQVNNPGGRNEPPQLQCIATTALLLVMATLLRCLMYEVNIVDMYVQTKQSLYQDRQGCGFTYAPRALRTYFLGWEGTDGQQTSTNGSSAVDGLVMVDRLG